MTRSRRFQPQEDQQAVPAKVSPVAKVKSGTARTKSDRRASARPGESVKPWAQKEYGNLRNRTSGSVLFGSLEQSLPPYKNRIDGGEALARWRGGESASRSLYSIHSLLRCPTAYEGWTITPPYTGGIPYRAAVLGRRECTPLPPDANAEKAYTRLPSDHIPDRGRNPCASFQERKSPYGIVLAETAEELFTRVSATPSFGMFETAARNRSHDRLHTRADSRRCCYHSESSWPGSTEARPYPPAISKNVLNAHEGIDVSLPVLRAYCDTRQGRHNDRWGAYSHV